ncbi:hypothetical protein BKA62DRAFT_429373 [Auriculariales sp. MPI-PUGE-AT-0066]|nr:hypothetical protein BKA62DRAFT_429373 [Auriculariales sp. MPI-PUGE-AT-0066]
MHARRSSSLVFSEEQLRRVWQWEVSSGHYPSMRTIPREIGIVSSLPNPARMKQRMYMDPQPRDRDRLHVPPRPVPGSIADLDAILRECDFETDQYVRDCLEYLRVASGLDDLPGRTSEQVDAWRYAFIEAQQPATESAALFIDQTSPSRAFKLRPGPLEKALDLPAVVSRSNDVDLPAGSCDPAYPRIFHMFWAGPFTDKPYMAILSYLYTQNTGLDRLFGASNNTILVCRPKFWIWIATGQPSGSVTNITAALADNPWSEPFLHPRFKDVIEFREWDTTAQLDSIPELRNDWRQFQDALINSGGYIVNAESRKKQDYDKPSVLLSNLARWVLCHRFGGIYIDADTIFLRDWEELWGWRGAFAYRWSFHDKFNSAVLRMHAGSAIGSFIFRTALRNGLDFHPMKVSKYLQDGQLDRLLFRCPDALFDPGFLTAEKYQMDRPPSPEFNEFGHFFEAPLRHSAAPQVVGFDGFFRGAWSYHWHSFWKASFDAVSDWPELGPRFIDGESRQRRRLLMQRTQSLKSETQKEKAARSRMAKAAQNTAHTSQAGLEDMDPHRDLSWSTVLKRTFEAYVRGERPSMYGEWLVWPDEQPKAR